MFIEEMEMKRVPFL